MCWRGCPGHGCTGTSPAIDKGAAVTPPLTTDQRGETRPRDFDDGPFPNAAGGNGSDIGAFEVQNTPPTITAAVGVTRQRGSAATNSVIANVGDIETPLGSLTVTVNGGATATDNLVTVSNIAVSATGVVSADIVADCIANPGNFTLTVTDGGGLNATANLLVLVTANTAPVLTYAVQNVIAGANQSFNPSSGPSDNGTFGAVTLQSITPVTGSSGRADACR